MVRRLLAAFGARGMWLALVVAVTAFAAPREAEAAPTCSISFNVPYASAPYDYDYVMSPTQNSDDLYECDPAFPAYPGGFSPEKQEADTAQGGHFETFLNANDNTIRYTVPAKFSGTDTFTVTFYCDEPACASGERVATVTVTVDPPVISFTTASLPGATAGVAYSQTVAATGGAAPYTYQVTAGALPSGLTLAADGSLTGTPAAVGTFNFTVTATDSTGGNGPFTGNRAFTITVAPPTIAVNPTSLPAGAYGAAYSQSLSASGGTAPYNFVVTGTLPQGLTLSGAGVLSGTPTAYGDFNFTVTARDATTGPGAPYGGSRAYTLTIAPPPAPSASNYVHPTPAPYTDGPIRTTTFSLAGQVTNSPTSYAVASSTTANGGSVSIDASGTVTYAAKVGHRGADSFTYTATNAGGTSSPATVTVTVGDPSYALSGVVPSGKVGAPYNATISLTGGRAPYANFSATGLPPGLSISSSGVISGTPTAMGAHTATITAVDSSTGAGPYTGSVTATISIASGADLEALLTAPSSVEAGQTGVFTATVRNVGTGPAANVSAQIALPTQTTFTSLTSPAGWSCTTPAVGAGGTVTCTTAALQAGSVADFTLSLTVASTATAGTKSLTLNVTSDTEAESATTSFEVAAPDMQAALTGPASVVRGQTATLTLTMNNAGDAATPHASWQSTLPTGLTFASLSVPAGWSCTTPAIGAGGTVGCGNPSGIAVGASRVFTLVVGVGAAAASPTTVNVMALTSYESEFPSVSFNVTEPAPAVTGLSPTSGPTAGGTTVVITGTDFTGATAVTFGGAPATSFTVDSATQITATAPAGTGTVDVRVTTAGGTSATSAADQFTYVLPADLTAALSGPATAVRGGTATLSATVGNAGPTASGAVTAAVPLPAGFTFASLSAPGGWSCTVPPVNGGGTASCSKASLAGGASETFTLVVRAGASAASPASLTLTATDGAETETATVVIGLVDPVPTLTAVDAPRGPSAGGTNVILQGADLAGATAVSWGGTAIPFIVISNSQIQVTTPAGTAGTSVDVTVTTPGGTSAPVRFDYVDLPTVVGLTPSAGPVAGGTNVVIQGANLAAASQVTLGGASVPFVVISDTALQITTPAHASGSFQIQVTVPYIGTSLASGASIFTYMDPPVATGFTAAAVAYNTGGAAASTIRLADHVTNAPTLFQVDTAGTRGTVALDPATGVVGYTPAPGFRGTDSFSFWAAGAGGTTETVAVQVPVVDPNFTVSLPSPLGQVGAAYTGSVTMSGGFGPYAGFSATGLPPGLTMDASGAISGTPTQAGSFTVTVTATDSSVGDGPFTGQAITSLFVTPPTMTLTPASLPGATVGNAYSAAFSASGGTAPYTYAVTLGALPAGLALAADGTLSGTPTAGGTFNFSVTATDASTGSAFGVSRAYSLTVSGPAVTITPASLPDALQGAAYSQTLTASGGTPGYAWRVAGGALPAGLSLSPTGALAGTPTEWGTFDFTLAATDSSTGTGPYTGSALYRLTVAAAAPSASDRTLAVPYGSAGVALDLTGAVAGATTSIAVATVPSHGTASVNGLTVTYTPSAGYYGADSFTYTATGPGGTSAPATVNVTVDLPPVPTVADLSVPVAFESPGQAIDLSVSVGGVYTSLAIASGAAHGDLTLEGTVATYTPAAGHFGADSFTFTATGPGGTSAPATVSLTVATPPPPEPAPHPGPAPVVSGAHADITITNTGGLVTGVEITTAPTNGTVTVDPIVVAEAVRVRASAVGFQLTYTPNPGYVGPDSFAYALVGPGGTSAPATVQLEVMPAVTVEPIEVSTLQGVPVQVDLTAEATGGPFTGAAVVSVGPAGAGTATVAQVGAAQVLTFAPADDFTGTAVVTFTLSNAQGSSLPSTVTVTVEARPDPALDGDVRGLIGAQVQAAQRFADTQLSNFNQRAEQLHREGDREGPRSHALKLGLGFGDYSGRMADPAEELRRREMPEQPFADFRRREDMLAWAGEDQTALNAAPGDGPIGGGKIALWSAGSLDFGQRRADAGGSKLEFTTSGVSLGADVEVADGLFVGVGAGYGYDATEIGTEGTRNASRAYSGAVYGSWRIAPELFLDVVAGGGQLAFDSRRRTPNDAMVRGQRDGSQAFGSLGLAWDLRDGPLTLSPYGRLTVSRATLDAFTETGDPIYALAYEAQEVEASFGTLGVRGDYAMTMGEADFLPHFRVQWTRQFEGAGSAVVRYADFLSGPSYQVDPLAQDRNALVLGIGGDWRWQRAFLSLDYEGAVNDQLLSHRITAKVLTRF